MKLKCTDCGAVFEIEEEEFDDIEELIVDGDFVICPICLSDNIDETYSSDEACFIIEEE